MRLLAEQVAVIAIHHAAIFFCSPGIKQYTVAQQFILIK
jgi:hypothetical protein